LITWQWAPDRGSARQVGKLLSLMCPGRTFVRATPFRLALHQGKQKGRRSAGLLHGGIPDV